MKNKDKPAFACVDTDVIQEGLTKREYFAGMAMQAMISNRIIPSPGSILDYSEDEKFAMFSQVSIKYADSLLNELDK